MKKYASHPQFKEVVFEFGDLVRGHFGEMEKKKVVDDKQAEERLQQKRKAGLQLPGTAAATLTPSIRTNDEVATIMLDPKVRAVIDEIQNKGGIDFNEFKVKDPMTAEKLMILMKHGVMHT